MTKVENKLIAEFMGYKLAPCSRGMAWENTSAKKSIDDKFKLHGRLFRENDHYYKWDSEWSWLMLVVEQIESLGYGVTIGMGIYVVIQNDWKEDLKEIVSMTDNNKLFCTYDAVVKFIKWYNIK